VPDEATVRAGPVWWPRLIASDACQEWRELRVWVERLVDRFGLDVRAVPPCWYRHNGLVEALAALRDCERACYAPTASPAGGVEWLRALRDTERFCRDAAARTGCSANEHRPDPARAWQTDDAEWEIFVHADAQARANAPIAIALGGE